MGLEDIDTVVLNNFPKPTGPHLIESDLDEQNSCRYKLRSRMPQENCMEKYIQIIPDSLIHNRPTRYLIQQHDKWKSKGRGQTDKKLTSTLVIQTFKVSSWPIFFKVWESFIFQQSF